MRVTRRPFEDRRRRGARRRRRDRAPAGRGGGERSAACTRAEGAATAAALLRGVGVEPDEVFVCVRRARARVALLVGGAPAWSSVRAKVSVPPCAKSASMPSPRDASPSSRDGALQLVAQVREGVAAVARRRPSIDSAG